MKKTMVTLAVLGSVAGLAQAQSAVTIYGIVDAGMTREDNGSTTVNRMDSGILSGSRLGFLGKEDLGGGMSAIFQLENGFNVDAGTQADAARFFNRLAFVGLTGSFGYIKLGRQNNPVYGNNIVWDPFNDALAGDSQRLFSYNGLRTDNLVTYGYSANGFRGEVQYGFGEVAGNTSASRTIAGFGGYRSGPIDVVLTYQNIRNAVDTDSTKMTLLGGNYDFGVVKTFFAYAFEKGVVPGATTKLDQRDALIGMILPVSSLGNIKASYIRKTDKLVTNANASQVAVAYTYDLSKRTTLYTSYGQLRNDPAAKYKVIVAGRTDKLFDFGVRHLF